MIECIIQSVCSFKWDVMYGCQIFGVGVKSEVRLDDDGRVIDGVKKE